MNYGRTHIEIDLDAVVHNIGCVRNRIPESTKLLTVVKADAYGHGAVEVSKALCDKTDFFGVASVPEGVQLRLAGIVNPILVLGYSDKNDIPDAVKYDIRIPVFTFDKAVELSREASKQQKSAKFHIAVDTGMSRIGLEPCEESVDLISRITALPFIEAEGIFSHFAESDENDLTRAIAQKELFTSFISMLEEKNICIPIKHINNSAAIMNFDDSFDMVRSGIVTYGLYPSKEVDRSLLDLKPVMSWYSTVFYVKKLQKGRQISYGGTFEATEDMIIATIPVGYADGYPRCLSNKGKVIINGHFAPVVGRVCMDFLMVDVTDIPCVKEGDTVVLVGTDGDASLTMEDVADPACSFNYELPCRITRRVTRIYKQQGKLWSVDYLL